MSHESTKKKKKLKIRPEEKYFKILISDEKEQLPNIKYLFILFIYFFAVLFYINKYRKLFLVQIIYTFSIVTQIPPLQLFNTYVKIYIMFFVNIMAFINTLFYEFFIYMVINYFFKIAKPI